MQKPDGKAMCAENLAELFDEETSLLVQIEALQKQIEDAVYAKKWTNFEEAQERLAQVRRELLLIEERRQAFFGGGQPVSSNDFYTWASALEEADREKLFSSYYALKRQSARVQTAAAAFSGYLLEMRRIVSGILDAAFPERRGYDPHGKRCAPDIRSVVLDRQF
ncbi:MAG: hypothetical protein LBG79_03325 [Spirochaetaceae bacterium]|jgi:hypothetical protein|nr:hypothetical protein [Spirochaetaceae bacterium]GMO17553.1 MAG: hypothetical protein Pg6A_04030 [Termitinemataceae bacterium]